MLITTPPFASARYIRILKPEEDALSRTVTFVTPENIPITYQTAGIAPRFMAFLVDFTIQLLLLGLASWLISLFGRFGSFGSILAALGQIAIYLIMFAYALIFEAAWNGRTPGKRLFGLRVIREGGYPIHFLASAIRNLLRFIDFGILPLLGSGLTLFGLPGLVSIFLSPNYKRIGDYAAGTLVIVERGISPFDDSAGTALEANVARMQGYVRNMDRLSVEEYRMLRRFVARRKQFEPAVQAALGERIARPLMEKLDIHAPIVFQIQYADLLEAMERCYAEERGVL
jgi:uncharacterized RDD family membrane protein YckC